MQILGNGMHGVQDLGELVKSPRAGGRVLPLASDDTVKFLNVIHSKFIKELLVLQAIHWNNTEEEQSLHAEELLRRDLKPPKLLREVPHPDTLAVHSGFVHPILIEDQIWSKVEHPGIDVGERSPTHSKHHKAHPRVLDY